jgi:collagen type VII alpha
MRMRGVGLAVAVFAVVAAPTALAAQGDSGAMPPGGVTGVTGVTGPTGTTGATGTTGIVGATGATGATGVTGITSSTPRSRGDGPTASKAARSTVDIIGGRPSSYAFSPRTISVRVGDAVIWDNRSSASEGHTVTGDGLDSGTLKQGEDYSFKFRRSGTFKYLCEFHPSMKGTVNVKGSGGGGGGSNGGGQGGGGNGGGGAGSSGSGGTSATGGDPGGTGSESAAGTSPNAGGSSSELPLTGFGVPPLAAVGGVLLLLGLLLRLPAVRDRITLL